MLDIHRHNNTMYRIHVDDGNNYILDYAAWCRENLVNGEWFVRDSDDYSVLYIKGETNMMAFKLRWE